MKLFKNKILESFCNRILIGVAFYYFKLIFGNRISVKVNYIHVRNQYNFYYNRVLVILNLKHNNTKLFIELTF